MKWAKPFITALLLFVALPGIHAEEIRSGLDDQTAVAITIYNENLALVRDQRKVTLNPGTLELAIRDVSAQIRPETALLTSLGQSTTIKLIEQNFDFDLLTPTSLLEKYIGQSVRAVTTNPSNGEQKIESAEVLAINQGLVLRFSDRIETDFPGRLIFDQVPANLRDRPTLVLQLENDNSNPQEIQLSYLTAGLSWKADYVASLNDEETSMDLNGWVTLTNQSGTTYANALLQLVAGDVQQVQREMPRLRSAVAMESMSMADNFAEESLFDYHLYTLERPTTLANQQTKQVVLMGAKYVPVKKRYLLDGANNYFGGQAVESLKQPIGVYLDFNNDDNSNLGIPLPGGIVRVYKNDVAGRTQFIGEDRIDHTPKNETILLKLGNAFDVTAKRTQTSFKKVPSQGAYNFSAEIGQKISFKNAKEQAVTIVLREMIPGDWRIMSESSGHQKLAANLVEWRISVPADGSYDHEYLTRIRY